LLSRHSEKSESRAVLPARNGVPSKGYEVVEDRGTAMELMEQYKEKIATGRLFAVRAFDGKFYFVDSELVESIGSEIVNAMGNKEMSLEEIAKSCELERGMVKAVVEVLRESGEVLEKRREVYSVA